MNIYSLKNIYNKTSFIAFIYLLLLLIFFRKVLIDPDWIVFGTDAIGHFNITNYLRGLIHKNGQYPLWIPVHFGGMPHFDATLATNVNIFALIYYIFPLTIAFNMYMILHFWFAGFFTFLFAEYLGLKRKSAFVSGLIFMFSGVLVSHLFVGHIPKVGTWAYLPLLCMLFGKGIDQNKLKYFLLASLVMGHQFLGYHMQMAYYTTLFVGAFIVFKIINKRGKKLEIKHWLIKPAVYSLISIILAVLLYSVQLIPSYTYTQKYSDRAGGTSYEFSSSWSFAPRELPGILIRDPFGYAWLNTDKSFINNASMKGHSAEPFVPYWGPMPQRLTGDYFGVLPFILAIIGIVFRRNRYSWFLAVSALVTLLLSMGKYTPIYWLAYKFVFGFSFFRVPSSIFALTVLCLSLLAGKGVQYLIYDQEKNNRESFRLIMWGIFIFTCLTLIITLAFTFLGDNNLLIFKAASDKYRFAVPPNEYQLMLMDRFLKIKNGMVIFSVFMVISTAIAYLRHSGRLKGNYLFSLIVLVILIDLWGNGSEFVKYQKIDKDSFGGNLASVKLIKKEINDEKFRTLAWDDRSISTGAIQVRDFAHHGIELINGRHDLAPNYYMQMINASMKNTKLLSLINTKYIIVKKSNDLRRILGRGKAFERQFQEVMTDEMYKLYRNNEYMDRGFIVNKARIVSDPKYVLGYMMRGDFDPSSEVVIEEKLGKPDGITSNHSYENEVIIESYTPNKIAIKASLKSDGFLVLADTYYPDWKVYVDGVEGKIYKADYALRGVYLRAGSHNVQFVYDSKILKITGSVSFITLILTLGGIVFIYWREGSIAPLAKRKV